MALLCLMKIKLPLDTCLLFITSFFLLEAIKNYSSSFGLHPNVSLSLGHFVTQLTRIKRKFPAEISQIRFAKTSLNPDVSLNMLLVSLFALKKALFEDPPDEGNARYYY